MTDTFRKKIVVASTFDSSSAAFTSCLPPTPPPPNPYKKNCMTFVGIEVVAREAKDNAYATFWAAGQVYYGRRANGE